MFDCSELHFFWTVSSTIFLNFNIATVFWIRIFEFLNNQTSPGPGFLPWKQALPAVYFTGPAGRGVPNRSQSSGTTHRWCRTGPDVVLQLVNPQAQQNRTLERSGNKLWQLRVATSPQYFWWEKPWSLASSSHPGKSRDFTVNLWAKSTRGWCHYEAKANTGTDLWYGSSEKRALVWEPIATFGIIKLNPEKWM